MPVQITEKGEMEDDQDLVRTWTRKGIACEVRGRVNTRAKGVIANERGAGVNVNRGEA